MNERRTKRFDSEAAWTGDRLSEGDWTVELTPAQIRTLREASQDIAESGRQWTDAGRSDYALAGWADLFAGLRDTLEGGLGFARIRRLPVDEVSVDLARLMLWGLGQHLGYPEPQDAAGNLLHDVRDTGKRLDTGNIRAYQTNLPINYHNDGADAFMLLCYRAAAAGGTSRLVSAVSVFNAILDRRPDLARILQEPFDFDARGQERPGAAPCQRVPIYTHHAGYLNVLYKREYIDLAQRFTDVPRLSPLQIEALDLMDRVCEDLSLEFVMEPGDLVIANNYDILHARSAFQNADTDADTVADTVTDTVTDTVAEPRHMMRLWLSLPNGRPLPPVFEQTREFYHSYTRRQTPTESPT